jgi:hypothetical protein
VGLDVTPRHLLLRAAARLEQEIRAYPRVYRAFYEALNRCGPVRDLVGRTKAGVRGGGATSRPPAVVEPALLRARREAAVAARLGLSDLRGDA